MIYFISLNYLNSGFILKYIYSENWGSFNFKVFDTFIQNLHFYYWVFIFWKLL